LTSELALTGAQSSLSNQQVPTYIEALATNGLLANAQMGYNLASVADPVQDSEITFVRGRAAEDAIAQGLCRAASTRTSSAPTA
jgi:hypothetical protein